MFAYLRQKIRTRITPTKHQRVTHDAVVNHLFPHDLQVVSNPAQEFILQSDYHVLHGSWLGAATSTSPHSRNTNRQPLPQILAILFDHSNSFHTVRRRATNRNRDFRPPHPPRFPHLPTEPPPRLRTESIRAETKLSCTASRDSCRAQKRVPEIEEQYQRSEGQGKSTRHRASRH